jgi:hypothetical protein
MQQLPQSNRAPQHVIVSNPTERLISTSYICVIKVAVTPGWLVSHVKRQISSLSKFACCNYLCPVPTVANTSPQRQPSHLLKVTQSQTYCQQVLSHKLHRLEGLVRANATNLALPQTKLQKIYLERGEDALITFNLGAPNRTHYSYERPETASCVQMYMDDHKIAI